MAQRVFIEYRVDGALANAFSVVLGSEDSAFGVRRQDTGAVVVADGTAVTNSSTGVYEFSFDPEIGVIYFVSWKIVPSSGDAYTYVTQTIGPFKSTSDIQVVSDYRGTFEQGELTTLKLMLTDFKGNSIDPESITLSVFDDDNLEVETGSPEKIVKGFYVYDWLIPADQEPGPHSVVWSYTIDGDQFQNLQGIIVVTKTTTSTISGSPYSDKISLIRKSLEYHISCAQNIPVYDEEGRICEDSRSVRFNFPRWNQNHLTRIYRNQKLVTGGISINYFKGEVIFEEPLHEDYDVVNADYNFRWFEDEALDRFLSNALHIVNAYPPVGHRTLVSIEDRYLPSVLYGAAIDALRQLILCLQFQEPKEVFGGEEGAKNAAGAFDTLKQNFEKSFENLLEQKKYGPYRGLTKMNTTPEFTLPGGRSRWFRYMMGGFNLS